MPSILKAPLTLTSRSLTQNVKIEVDIFPDSVLTDDDDEITSKIVHVTNGKVRMCEWKIESSIDDDIDIPEGAGGELRVTLELLNVVKDSEVKVILNGVVLDVHGLESNVRGSAGGVIKKGGELKMVLASNVTRRAQTFMENPWTIYGVNIGHEPKARLDLAIEYLDQNIPNKEAVMKKFMETSSKDFSQTMKDLLASPSFTNAKIVCSDGTEINVNKEILASRCPVFEAMFRTDMKEAATGVVQVSDIFGKSMKVLVEYLTTGKLDESWNQPDVVTHLAVAADKYGIEPLREFLNDWLGEEEIVRSNFDLLNVVADCGYPKAEEKIAVNVARRAKRAKTRDQLVASIGLKREPLNKLRKKRAEKELLRWMNNQLGPRVATASSLEMIIYAADEGLDVAERQLVKELGRNLEPARSRDQVLKVLGTGEK